MSWTTTPPWIDDDDDTPSEAERARREELDELDRRSLAAEAEMMAAVAEDERQRFARSVGLDEDVDGGPYLAVRRWLR